MATKTTSDAKTPQDPIINEEYIREIAAKYEDAQKKLALAEKRIKSAEIKNDEYRKHVSGANKSTRDFMEEIYKTANNLDKDGKVSEGFGSMLDDITSETELTDFLKTMQHLEGQHKEWQQNSEELKKTKKDLEYMKTEQEKLQKAAQRLKGGARGVGADELFDIQKGPVSMKSGGVKPAGKTPQTESTAIALSADTPGGRAPSRWSSRAKDDGNSKTSRDDDEEDWRSRTRKRVRITEEYEAPDGYGVEDDELRSNISMMLSKTPTNVPPINPKSLELIPVKDDRTEAEIERMGGSLPDLDRAVKERSAKRPRWLNTSNAKE